MNKVIYSLAMAVLLGSCAKKDTGISPEEVTHAVNFSIDNFKEDVVSYPAKSSAVKKGAGVSTVSGPDLKSYSKIISYVVFNEKGVKVKDSVQRDSSKDFGNVKLRLRDGKYTMYLAAGTGVFSGSKSALLLKDISHLGDQFYKRVDFTVESKDADYSTELSRVGAKLVIKLTQEWPAVVTKVTFQMNVPNRLNFASGKGENSHGTSYPEYVFGEDAESRLLESSWFCGMFSGEKLLQTGILTAYNSSNQVLYQRTIDNIQIEHNKITTLTGNLFTSKISGFDIKIDEAWAGNIDQTF